MKQRTAQSQPQPAGLAEVFPWLAPDEESRRLLHAAVLLAVAVHLWLFAITWPRVVETAHSHDSGDTVQVLRLQDIRLEQPKPKEKRRTLRKTIPGPDPHPDEPDIVERAAPTEEIEAPWDEGTVLASVENVPPPPAASVEPPQIVDVGTIDAPRVLERVQPAYTRAAINARLEGVVVLELVIGEDGLVENVRVLRRLALGLTGSAVTAVRRWRFEPSTLDGRPIKVRYRLTVHFELR